MLEKQPEIRAGARKNRRIYAFGRLNRAWHGRSPLIFANILYMGRLKARYRSVGAALLEVLAAA